MAKKGQISIYDTQKSKKPDVKEIINQTCDGEVKQRSLELVDYFLQLRMKPTWASTNSYTLNYKGKRVGYFKVGSGDKFTKNDVSINIYPIEIENYEQYLLTKSEYEKDIFKNEFLNSFLKYCSFCGKCAPGKDISIFGDTYKNVCKWHSSYIINPTANQLNFIIEMINLRRDYINNSLIK